jgi:hypothetical protein
VYMIDDEASCLPANYPTADTSFFFSPGIACPSGYWTACHDTAGFSSITTVVCCPIRGDITLSCAGKSVKDLWESLQCTWIAPRETGTVVTVTKSDDGRTSTVTAQLTSPGGINAYGIRMVYQSSDLVVSESESASLGTTAVSSGAAATTTTPITTPSLPVTSEPGSSSGLSTGATAAIGVVVPLVVLAALAGLAVWWRKRRRASQEGVAGAGAASELEPQTKPEDKRANYYGNGPFAHEVQGTWNVPEMPSQRTAAELPADPAHGGNGDGVRYK